MKRLHLFRPGKHTAASGVAFDFTEAQLQATADAYDPAKHEAPIVVGHPRQDGPAYGWVKSLAFSDDGLRAEPHQVDAAFAELVSAGRFKKISASFYSPTAPTNPVPGVFYLRHVGFLGAQPPAVKGLRSPEFGEAEDGVIEFADWSDVTNAGLWRNLRDWFIEQFGKDKADAVVPDYSVTQLQAAAAQETADTAAAAPAYSEKPQGDVMTPAEIAAREAALKIQSDDLAAKAAEQARKDAEFAERETRLADQESANRAAAAAAARAEVAAFVEGLVTAGKVLPTHKDGMVAFMCGIAPELVIEFGEGDNKVSKSGAEWLREFLQAQPKLVEFGERGAGDGAENAADDPQSIANRALEFQESEKKAGREISVSAAVKHITSGK